MVFIFLRFLFYPMIFKNYNKKQEYCIDIYRGDVKMIKTKKMDEIIINSHFTSKTEEEIALNMSKIIAKLINRDLENMDNTEDKEEAVALSI